MKLFTAIAITVFITTVTAVPRMKYGAKSCGTYRCPRTWVPYNPYVKVGSRTRAKTSERRPKRNPAIYDLDEIMTNRHRYKKY